MPAQLEIDDISGLRCTNPAPICERGWKARPTTRTELPQDAELVLDSEADELVSLDEVMTVRAVKTPAVHADLRVWKWGPAIDHDTTSKRHLLVRLG